MTNSLPWEVYQSRNKSPETRSYRLKTSSVVLLIQGILHQGFELYVEMV